MLFWPARREERRGPRETKLKRTGSKLHKMGLITLFFVLMGARGQAQTATEAKLPDAPAAPERSIEDLNLIGSAAAMPAFADSNIDVNSAYRRALLSKGVGLRLIQQVQYAQNVLQAPAAADDQVYVGERSFEGALEHLILTADLRQFHLKHAQFYGSALWNWVSWNPAGPRTIQIWDLYLYKAFGGDRLEMKAGYISNDLEFVGLMVGGSTASGAQGVYAVLPYEVGTSYFPLAMPSVNVRMRGPRNTYVKAAAQRSLDAGGGPAEVARNHTGFRFDPKGDKLLVLGEAGYLRAASATAGEAWFRAGYFHNDTLFLNHAKGKMEPGNYVAYALMDYQVRRPDALQPGHGLYVGGSVMTVPSQFDAYDRYLEARIYEEGPFGFRPADMVSFVSSYTGHSKYFTDPLLAAGKTVWRNSVSLTGSYSLHVRQGNYLAVGLSYIRGAAITPRVDDAVNFASSYTLFF